MEREEFLRVWAEINKRLKDKMEEYKEIREELTELIENSNDEEKIDLFIKKFEVISVDIKVLEDKAKALRKLLEEK